SVPGLCHRTVPIANPLEDRPGPPNGIDPPSDWVRDESLSQKIPLLQGGRPASTVVNPNAPAEQRIDMPPQLAPVPDHPDVLATGPHIRLGDNGEIHRLRP